MAIDPVAGAALLGAAPNPILMNPAAAYGSSAPQLSPGSTDITAPSNTDTSQVQLPNPTVPTGATLGQRSPVLSNLAKGMNVAAAAAPQAAASPGGWARSLLAGAANVISGGASAIGSGLGDVAAANNNYRPGQGGLSGIANVMAARNQRMAQQTEQQSKLETDKALRAEAVARTVRLYYDMRNSDQTLKNNLATNDASVLKANEDTHQTVNDLSQSQIDQFEKDNPQWFDKWRIKVTGWTPATNADGTPSIDQKSQSQIYNPVYSRQALKTKDGLSSTQNLTPEMIADINRSGLTSSPISDTQKTIPMDDFNAIWPKVQQFDLAQKRAEEANGEALSAANQREANGLLQDSHVAAAVTDGVMPLVGINGMLDNIGKQLPQLQAQLNQLQAKNPNDPQIAQIQKSIQDKTDLQQKLVRYKVVGVSDQQRTAYAAYTEKQDKEAEQKLKDAAEIRQKNSAAALDDAKAENERNQKQGLDESNIAMSDRLQQQIAALPPDLKAVLQTAPSSQQASLMSVAFGDGDVDDKKLFPTSPRPKSGLLGESQAWGIISQLNPNMTQQMYDIKHNAYKDATSSSANSLGAQAGSLNNFIGHAAEARDIANQFYNSDPKIFKTLLNAVDKATWGTQVTALQEAITVVNDEFQNMVHSGHAATAEETAAQHALVSANSTVGQINAAFNVLGRMGATRANTMNEQYRTKTGVNFPNLIYPANVDDARKLGIPVERYNSGGRIGVPNQPGQRPAANAGAGNAPKTPTPPPGHKNAVYGPDGTTIIGYN